MEMTLREDHIPLASKAVRHIQASCERLWEHPFGQ